MSNSLQMTRRAMTTASSSELALRFMNTPRAQRFDRAVDGILLLDKPQGMSSNAALQQARVALRALKAGHAGSLDPLATGMLPLCFGQATKVCGYLLESRKSYRVIARLGIRTDSADADGAMIETAAVPTFDEAKVQQVLASFLGPQQQVPPMYSALKHQGQRLYELARRGEVIERAPRDIVIERMELLRFTADEVEFEVRCSKGTYVRSLVEDLAARLGTVGHVTLLRRTQVDPFDASRMVTLEQLDAARAEGGPAALDAWLLPADAALAALPALQLDEARATDLSHGRRFGGLEQETPGLKRVYGPQQRFLGLVRVDAHGTVIPDRLFT